jgi:hypothetical protein
LVEIVPASKTSTREIVAGALTMENIEEHHVPGTAPSHPGISGLSEYLPRAKLATNHTFSPTINPSCSSASLGWGGKR